MITLGQTLAEAIAEEAGHRGLLTNAAIAQAIGCDNERVSKWLKGATASPAYFKRLARFLHCHYLEIGLLNAATEYATIAEAEPGVPEDS